MMYVFTVNNLLYNQVKYFAMLSTNSFLKFSELSFKLRFKIMVNLRVVMEPILLLLLLLLFLYKK